MSLVNTSNYRKYQTRNPVVRWWLANFFRRLTEAIHRYQPIDSLLDAGCGEGEAIARLAGDLPRVVSGFDVNPASVAYARSRHPQADLRVADIYAPGFGAKSHDLVICCEVLEHLQEPLRAVEALQKIARRGVIFSVPHEPYFRIKSFVRGKYLRTFGNHPEHVQHWNIRTLRQFLAPHFAEVTVLSAFPWIIADCRLEGPSSGGEG